MRGHVPEVVEDVRVLRNSSQVCGHLQTRPATARQRCTSVAHPLHICVLAPLVSLVLKYCSVGSAVLRSAQLKFAQLR